MPIDRHSIILVPKRYTMTMMTWSLLKEIRTMSEEMLYLVPIRRLEWVKETKEIVARSSAEAEKKVLEPYYPNDCAGSTTAFIDGDIRALPLIKWETIPFPPSYLTGKTYYWHRAELNGIVAIVEYLPSIADWVYSIYQDEKLHRTPTMTGIDAADAKRKAEALLRDPSSLALRLKEDLR